MQSVKTLERIQTACLAIISTIAVAIAIQWLQPVLIPLVLAVFLAIGLTPVVSFLMHRIRLPQTPAVILTLILGLALLAIIGMLVSGSIAQLANNAHTYQDRIQSMLSRLAEILPLERMGISKSDFLQPLSQISGKNLGSLIVNIGSSLTGIASNAILVLIFLCFLLFGRNMAPVDQGHDFVKIETEVRRYILVKTIISAITGVLVGMILGLLGIELAIMFGLLTFLLNFLPSIGSIIAVLLPVPVVLFTKDLSPVVGMLAILLPGTVQFAIGNVIEPKLMGKSFDLHPITVLAALIFWGMLWGIIGMFLATPITAVARIILHKYETTRPLAEILSGRLR